jgi:ABC-type nitrate/sulfonate/bicarbonate transport system permease component
VIRGIPVAVGLAALLLVIVIWWLVTDVTHLMSPHILASPVAVAKTLGNLMVHPFAGSTLPQHAAASLNRWARGFGFAIIIGVPLGAIFAWYADARSAINPIFETLRYIPPFAWIPLAILWLGIGTTAQASVVFVAAFPPCVINTHKAIVTIEPTIFKAARTAGASRISSLMHVAMPTATPGIVAGLRIAVSNGWMALMGAELIVGTSGLGFLINAGGENGEPSVIIAGMVCIGVLGFALDEIVQVVTRPLLQWRKGMESGD